MRPAGALVALVLPLLVTACALGGRGDPSQGAGEEGLTVEVTNYNWQDMHVYVLASGQRHSLGIVTSQSTQSFDVPSSALAARREITFLADPVGSVLAYVSDPVLVEPGDRVAWTIQNRLSHSSVFVR